MNVNLYNLFQLYGLGSLLVAISVLVVTSVIRTHWFSEWWVKQTDKLIVWFMKRKVKESNTRILLESDIVNHDIFNYIDFWIFSKIPAFQFSTEYRTVVFKRYLTIYLNCYKREILKFIKDSKYQEMDQSKLWRSLLELINNIVSTYEKECEDAGIPKIVIMKMKAKNNDVIALVMDLIDSISNSQIYQGDKNYLKIYSILNIILSVLENTIQNSESICNSINGQLKNSTFSDGTKIYKEP